MCYYSVAMRPIEALYENGLLHPAKPLNLRSGERVELIVVRRSDPKRWDLKRLASAESEDVDLASAGLDDFGARLDDEDMG
jgi:predicted DNA-binding antitoxin AbrB/MazE fold protein